MARARSEPNPRLDMLILETGKLSLHDLERLRSWLDNQIHAREEQASQPQGQGATSGEPAFEATLHVTEEVGVPDIPVRIVGSELLQQLVKQHLVDGICPTTSAVCPMLTGAERKKALS